MGAGIYPAAFGEGKRDAVPGFGLADGFGFGAKLRRVAARFSGFVKPQVNHFVLQNLAQGRCGRIATHAANRERRREKLLWLECLDQKRDGKANQALFDVDSACRAGEAAAPADFAGWQNASEKLAVELVVKGG